MAIPKSRKFDDIHSANLANYAKKVRKAYLDAIKEVSKLAVGANLNADTEFFFKNNPTISKKVDKLVKQLYSEVYSTTISGINSEWDLAVEKNNQLAQFIFGQDVADLSNEVRDKYFSNNNAARLNFLNRKDNGLGLSDKIWKNSQQFKQELELALELGIGKGKSAANIARNVTQYLNEPDKLFRRVRAKEGGVLRLSKAAKAYNPGQGRYRSSYKNALRLTANETNFSYEGSQHEKRQQQDFIVGIEIKVSPRHQASDDAGGISCLSLQGKYPKNFDFTYKWHVNCRCQSFNILKTQEELDADVDKILVGEKLDGVSKNAVDSVPKSYTGYLKANQKKWENWKKQPRTFENNKDFLKDTPVPRVSTPAESFPNSTFILDGAAQARLITNNPSIQFEINDGNGNPLGAYQATNAFGTFDFESLINNAKLDFASIGGAYIDKVIITIDFSGKGLINVLGSNTNFPGSLITIKRTFNKLGGKIVNHATFDIPKGMQGSGFSKKILSTYYREYQRAGITQINVYANIDVGGYTWARYGFSMHVDFDIQDFLTKRIIGNPTLLKEASEIVTRYQTEFPGKAFPMNLIANIKGMKPYLLGSEWNGVLDLTDAVQKAYFEDYLMGR